MGLRFELASNASDQQQDGLKMFVAGFLALEVRDFKRAFLHIVMSVTKQLVCSHCHNSSGVGLMLNITHCKQDGHKWDGKPGTKWKIFIGE